MRRFLFNKLVRDKVVTNMVSSGASPMYTTLSGDDYLMALKDKLLEEASELPLTRRDALLEELADIQEVIYCLMSAAGISPNQLEDARKLKNSKSGSFQLRHFVNNLDTTDDSPWLEYFLSNEDKYPEIKD